MRLTRPKRGKDEFDHDSKCVIYQKFLESRGKAFDGGRGGKNIHAFLVRKFAFERNNFESLSTVGVFETRQAFIVPLDNVCELTSRYNS